jgi:hypothetical protein
MIFKKIMDAIEKLRIDGEKCDEEYKRHFNGLEAWSSP